MKREIAVVVESDPQRTGQTALPDAEAMDIIRIGAAALARRSQHPMDVIREIGAAYAAGEWCQQYASWADFLAYEYGIRPRSPDAGATDDRSVYFTQAVDGGPIKIGVTEDVPARLASLQTGSPLPLRVLATLPAVGQRGEADIHERFASARRHGEWFESTPDLLAYITANGVPA